ncbi:MAG: TonB-dependent receptor [Chitinophagales bacterium]|nr:TonB-dependent receptor [Chitinophagales bacterium]
MDGDTCMSRRCGLLLWLLVVLTCPSFAFDPGNASVTVVKGDDGKPLADAIVKIVLLDSAALKKVKFIAGLTDVHGTFQYQFTEPVIVQISHLGFTTLTDTVYTIQNKTYHLNYASQDVKDVVVTGQYAPGSPQKSVYEVKVINAETIKAKGANNLREALQNELHIDLGQDNVFGSSMSINGISGEGVKIMVDGVPVVGRLDGKLDLSQINISNIERIEIVEGPLSVIYGTDAMGGVVNIITKTFQQQKVNLNLKGYYESVGQYNAELNAGFAFKKNQLYLSGGRYFFGGFTTFDSIARFKEWKPKEQYFADAKYLYTGNRFRVSLSGAFFRELMLNRSAPRQTLSFENNDTAWTYVGDDVKYLTYRPRAAASFMYRFKEGYQLDVLAAYSGFIRFTNLYSKNLVTQKEQLVAAPNLQDTARYHQALVRATYNMAAWKNRLNFMFGIETTNEITRQTRIENGKQRMDNYAAFGSIRVSVVEGLDIQPAIRITYNTRFRVPLIPSLNVKYGYKDRVVFRASYGRGYRAPSLKELYLVFFDSNHSLKGNESLQPEDGHTANASVSYTQPIKKEHFLTFSASAFYNNIKDKIDWRIRPSIGPEPDTFQYFNIKRYITYGGDVALGYRWKRLMVNTSVLFTRYELSNTQGGSDKVKFLSPDFTASFSYTIPKAELTFSAFYKFNGRKPLFSINNSIQAGTRNSYHMLDVSLARSFWKERIQVIVGGKNLVGVRNVTATGISSVGHNLGGNAVNIGWGRTFFASLILHYGK